MILENYEIVGIEEVIKTEEYQNGAMSRLPDEVRKKINKYAMGTAFQTCGVELRFEMVSDEIEITFTNADNNGIGVFEVYFGDFRLLSYFQTEIEKGKSFTINIKAKQDWDDRLYAAYDKVPHQYEMKCVRVLMPSGRYELPVIKGEVKRWSDEFTSQKPLYLAYGSSITNGSGATIPSNTYVKRVASSLGAELINLGFPGTCMADEAVADFINSRYKPDYITVELGVNMIWDVDENCWNRVSMFEKSIKYFIEEICAHNPQAKILITNMFTCGNHLKNDTEICEFEEYVRACAKSVEKRYQNVRFVEGTKLLSDCCGLTADILHPADRGMEEIADNISEILSRKDL